MQYVLGSLVIHSVYIDNGQQYSLHTHNHNRWRGGDRFGTEFTIKEGIPKMNIGKTASLNMIIRFPFHFMIGAIVFL